MPSMNIIKEKWDFLNSTSTHVPKQVSKLYKFGVQVLAFREIISLRVKVAIKPYTPTKPSETVECESR